MIRPLTVLAVALVLNSAAAQVAAGAGGGSPIKVEPVQIGPPSDGGRPVNPPRAGEQAPSTPPAVPQAAPAPSPVPLGNCNAGGCWDTRGNRYNDTGDGSRFISPEGRLCQTNGKFIHCN